MSQNDSFPPMTPPPDRAKYRQFLIDHGFDPNLDRDDLARARAEKSEAEQSQLEQHWKEFVEATRRSETVGAASLRPRDSRAAP